MRKNLSILFVVLVSMMALSLAVSANAFASTSAVPACENSSGSAPDKNKHCLAGPPTDPCYPAASTVVQVVCVKTWSCRLEITGTGLNQVTRLDFARSTGPQTYYFDDRSIFNPPGGGISYAGDGNNIQVFNNDLCGATLDEVTGYVSDGLGGDAYSFTIVGPITLLS